MADPPAPAETGAPRPQTWLQYAIVYPTLLLALGGSIPTVVREVKAWRLGVRASQLELVQEQQRLWEQNLPCIEQQGIYEADSEGGLVIRVTLCASGDILVRYHDNDFAPVYRWLARPARKGPDHAPFDTPAAAPARRLRGSP